MLLPSSHVLLVEDDPKVAEVLAGLLQDDNIRLTDAHDATEALTKARENTFDLILLDLHLPDIPGWEVLAHLKATKETRDIPTIVLSADATTGQIERLLAAGARAYITKPLDVDQFLNLLEQTNDDLNRANECALANS